MADTLQQSPVTPAAVRSPAGALSRQEADRLHVFLHAVAFVAGFTAVFTLLGSAVGFLGHSLNVYLPVIQKLGALLLVLFALVTLGFFRWLAQTIQARTDITFNPAAAALVNLCEFFNGLLYTEKRVTAMHNVSPRWGLLSSAMLGVAFSAGWVPCIGPILASIFFLAGNSATAAQGALLLAIYSLGLGIPFLITGAAFASTTRFWRKLNRHMHIVSIISGIFLLYVAYMLWTDSLAVVTTQFASLNEWVFGLEDWLGVASGTGGDIISLPVVAAAPLAFTAGLISFLSPCVLPLVPAYIGYLSGAAVGSGRA
jgi:cytochrome c-type biogenesis protein